MYSISVELGVDSRQKYTTVIGSEEQFGDPAELDEAWAQRQRYGRQRWMKRGYRHTSLMWCLLRSQVRKRSRPRPYPP